MKLKDVKVKARRLGIEPGEMSKKDLIHSIQSKEGFTPCFASGIDCKETDCCWKGDCGI